MLICIFIFLFGFFLFHLIVCSNLIRILSFVLKVLRLFLVSSRLFSFSLKFQLANLRIVVCNLEIVETDLMQKNFIFKYFGIRNLWKFYCFLLERRNTRFRCWFIDCACRISSIHHNRQKNESLILNFILLTLCYLLFHIICHQILQLEIKMEALFSRKVSTIRYEAHLMICH